MTFVRFPNIAATSANGRLRVEIRGTADGDFFRDQSDFVYRLYRSDALVWEWSASKKRVRPEFLDDYPHEAWVSDDGWVVVRTHEWFSAGLLVLSPEGRAVLRLSHRRLLDTDEPGFLDSEPERYMGDSSAGPFWAEFAFAYFTEYLDRPCWTIRTWWGKRVCIDLANAKLLDSTALDEDRARVLEIDYVQRVLATGVDEIERMPPDAGDDVESCSRELRVLAAAYHAGWLQSTDSIPYLRRLEAQERLGSQGFGPIAWATLRTLSYRQVAKISLLRMGQEPSWQSHYWFEFCDGTAADSGDGGSAVFRFPSRGEQRNPNLLQPGLTQKETLRCLGAPDFILREAWEYDFLSATEAFTAKAIWDEPQLADLPIEQYKAAKAAHLSRIVRVEIVDPQWKRITKRDFYMR